MKTQKQTEIDRQLKIRALQAMSKLPRWYMDLFITANPKYYNKKELVRDVANGFATDVQVTLLLETLADNLRK